MNRQKKIVAILTGTIRRTLSAQPAYFLLGSRASWADKVRLIVPVNMATNFFCRFILVKDHVVGQT